MIMSGHDSFEEAFRRISQDPSSAVPAPSPRTPTMLDRINRREELDRQFIGTDPEEVFGQQGAASCAAFLAKMAVHGYPNDYISNPSDKRVPDARHHEPYTVTPERESWLTEKAGAGHASPIPKVFFK